MAEGARLEIVYVSKGASRVRIPLSPPVFVATQLRLVAPVKVIKVLYKQTQAKKKTVRRSV